MRKELNLLGNVMDLVYTMSEGNPGAISVLANLLNREEAGLTAILNLDDMNIRGSQIWVAFKYHCNNDLDKLMILASDRDQAMVDTVNRECAQRDGGTEEIAVVIGASFVREK